MHRRSVLKSALALPLVLASPALASPTRIRTLYDHGNLSDWAVQNEGKRVTFQGFMAPPLKARSSFFVLTKMPMTVCPFCETEAEWPEDILAVYTKRTVKVISYNVKIEVRGVLSLGAYKDPDTGFVSMVRLSDATYG
jgi:hypothetical protein